MPAREKVRTGLRWLLALVLVGAGVNHFLNPAFYIAIMPDYLPLHAELVYASGVAEVAIGMLMLAPRPRLLRLAGWAAIALLIAVFPANVHMALHPERYPNLTATALYARLPFQAVFILWAWWTCLRDPRARSTPATRRVKATGTHARPKGRPP
jgi:uncharacterized membrane protein